MQTSPEYEKRKMTNRHLVCPFIRAWVYVCCIFVISPGYMQETLIFLRHFSEGNLEITQTSVRHDTDRMSKGNRDRNISKKNGLPRRKFYSVKCERIIVCDKKSPIKLLSGFSRGRKNSADIHSIAWIFISDCDIIPDKYIRESRNAKGRYIVNIDI